MIVQFNENIRERGKTDFDYISEVPSLELCKKLKEMGYPQEGGGWYWREFVLTESWGKTYLGEVIFNFEGKEGIKAPSIRELLEELPDCIIVNDFYYYLKIERLKKCYIVFFEQKTDHYKKEILEYFIADDESFPNTLTEMWIRLVEKGYIEVKK